MLSVPQIAKRLGVLPRKVQVWIRSGELVASNLAASAGGRSRFKVRPDDLEAFLVARQPKRPRGRRRGEAQAVEPWAEAGN